MTRTLHVQIKSTDRSGLEERLEAIDAGEDVEPSEPTLSIENLETFGRVFRSTNLELLEAIVEHEPESIRELARLVDRNPPEVLENVNELADYGLIELEEDGRAKRPVVWYDKIDADIPLTPPSGQGRKANAWDSEERDDPLWCRIDQPEELSYQALHHAVRAAAHAAGVEKPATFTNLRKSSASHLARRGMIQAHLEDHHGWVRESDIASRYIATFAFTPPLNLRHTSDRRPARRQAQRVMFLSYRDIYLTVGRSP